MGAAGVAEVEVTEATVEDAALATEAVLETAAEAPEAAEAEALATRSVKSAFKLARAEGMT